MINMKVRGNCGVFAGKLTGIADTGCDLITLAS